MVQFHREGEAARFIRNRTRFQVSIHKGGQRRNNYRLASKTTRDMVSDTTRFLHVLSSTTSITLISDKLLEFDIPSFSFETDHCPLYYRPTGLPEIEGNRFPMSLDSFHQQT